MRFKEFVRREVEAYKRDKEYYAKPSYTLDDFMEHQKLYPSLLERKTRVVGWFHHQYSRFEDVVYNIRSIGQRARRGWSTRDAMDMTTLLPREIAAKLRYFQKHAYSVPWEYLPDEAFDEFGDIKHNYDGPIGTKWDAILEDLAQRFEAYANGIEEHYELEFATVEESNAHYQKLQDDLNQTFADFAKIFRHLSW